MISHKIRIYPTTEQVSKLKQACGINRFVYNWGLIKWQEMYKANLSPSLNKVKLEYNKEKKDNDDLKWLYDVSKCVGEYALMDLNIAFQSFFKKRTKYPIMKKKKFGIGSFSIANDKFWVKDKIIRLPKIGKIKLAERLRFNGKIMKGTVSHYANRWFVSIITNDSLPPKSTNNKIIGIDLGLKDQLVLSNGEKYNCVELNKELKRVKKEQQSLSRKKKGSKNRFKQLIKLQIAWLKYKDKLNDWSNKITTILATEYQYIGLETLDIKGMMKNKYLAKLFQANRLGVLIEKLKSKASVLQVDRYFPSSKTCSSCGYIYTELKLKERRWKCISCGKEHDRDINAAINLVRQAMSEFTPMDTKALIPVL